MPVYIHMTRSLNSLVPVVEDRMVKIRRRRVEASFPYKVPNDIITWYVIAVLGAHTAESVKTPEAIASRLIFLSLATNHSMTVSMVNILLDLLSSAPEHQYYEQLRAEAKSVFQSEKDWTDPASLEKLLLTDFAIRESLRRDPINVRGLLREVVQKYGMKLPDGNHVAKGAWLGIPQRNAHINERFYSNLEEHKPIRFARSRQG
ncbi:hypothetical protein OEA41_006496 [Lepraria neglecta]|uniref:Cytochrome P450 n=1 Tax=Lepraria neglecta TaxID=209136 RepID=A0AAD9ZBB1_9LECA|nr:hypothetical protein OEA41_006496 [Lepraria neglecta]